MQGIEFSGLLFRHGITQQEFADFYGCTQKQVSLWCSDKAEVPKAVALLAASIRDKGSMLRMEQRAEQLEVSLEHLLHTSSLTTGTHVEAKGNGLFELNELLVVERLKKHGPGAWRILEDALGRLNKPLEVAREQAEREAEQAKLEAARAKAEARREAEKAREQAEREAEEARLKAARAKAEKRKAEKAEREAEEARLNAKIEAARAKAEAKRKAEKADGAAERARLKARELEERQIRTGATPWNKLGIKRDATAQESKAARNRLAKAHHPDVGGAPGVMERINDAYEQVESSRRAA